MIVFYVPPNLTRAKPLSFKIPEKKSLNQKKKKNWSKHARTHYSIFRLYRTKLNTIFKAKRWKRVFELE